jgi:transcriptional regulator with XRE-family HTH domain
MKREQVLERLGERVRELRLARDLTQEGLAQLAEVDRGYISETETGDRNPSVWVIYRLAKALEVEPAELLPGYED